MNSRLQLSLLLSLVWLTQVAWTQHFTFTGAPVHWDQREVWITMDAHGTDDIPMDLEFEAISASLKTWNDVPCPHPKFQEGSRVSRPKPGPKNNENLLLFCDDISCWSTPEVDHVIALTTLYYNNFSGVIKKFDMEFADWAYQFTVTVGPERQTDLQNAVTHELGHVLGLDHSEEPEATMYYWSPPGDLDKRTLAADDQTGLCLIYQFWLPVDQEASLTVDGGLGGEETETRVSPGGCGAGQEPQSPTLWLAFLVLGMLRLCRQRHNGICESVAPERSVHGPGNSVQRNEGPMFPRKTLLRPVCQ